MRRGRMPGMEHERRKPPRFGLALAIVFLLLLLYVLSIGPAYRLAATGRISESAFNTTYVPIFWIGQHSDTASQLIIWYCELWYLPEFTLAPYPSREPSP